MFLINPAGEYPRHIGDLIAEHPDYVDGVTLPDGWVEVLPGVMPFIPKHKKIVELPPAQNADGEFVRQFDVVDMTAAEIEQFESTRLEPETEEEASGKLDL